MDNPKRKYVKKQKGEDHTLTSEFKIGAFLYAIYMLLKQNSKTPITKKAKEFGLNHLVTDAMKDLKIVKSNGKQGPGVEWEYIGPQPNDATAKKVFDRYTELLRESVQRIREARPDNAPSHKKTIFDTEAISILNDKLDTIIAQNEKLIAMWETPLQPVTRG